MKTQERKTRKYGDGERRCPVCGEPLPAHQVWPGARYRFCGKPECVAQVKRLPRGAYIGAKEHKCAAKSCENFLPEGRYRLSAKLYCSADCWHRCEGRVPVQCDCGCEKWFMRKPKRKTSGGLVFMSKKHRGSYLRNKRTAEACGDFNNVVSAYLHGFASIHYSNLNQTTSALRPF